MRRLRAVAASRFLRTPIALALAALSVPALAAPGARVGGEFRLSTVTAGSQELFDVAIDADGDAVAVWLGTLPDGATAVFARRYDNAGQPLGEEFQVNAVPLIGATTQQFSTAFVTPDVAMDGDGDFVVTWAQPGDFDGGGACPVPSYHYAVFARRYNAAGAALGGEFLVNQSSQCDQAGPNVAMASDGRFAIAWQGPDGANHGIYARHFQADGTAATDEFLVNQVTLGRQSRAAVAMDADGDLVVAWHSYGRDGSAFAVSARRLGPLGDAFGDEFVVNTTTAGDQTFPAVAMAPGGDFWVAWSDYDAAAGPRRGVRARRYDASGAAAGGEFLVNSAPLTRGTQFIPGVALDHDGDAVVAWWSGVAGRVGDDVRAQRFTAAGAASGPEFLVNTFTDFHQNSPAVALDADGDHFVAWTSGVQDGSLAGAFAQRFSGPENVDLNVAVAGPAGPVAPGATVIHEVTVTNQHAVSAIPGVGAATNVQSLVALGNAEPGSAVGDGWNCDTIDIGYAVYHDCRYLGALLPGEAAQYTVTSTAPAENAGPMRFDADQAHDQHDADATDDVVERTIAVARDTVPNAFAFTDRTNLPTGSFIFSNTITISGINSPAPIEVSSGSATRRYQINGGDYVSAPGTVMNGDTVRLRVQSPGQANTTFRVTATIGGVSDVWNVTTGATDTTPSYGFADVAGAARGVVVTSAPVTPTGFNAPATLSIAGAAGRGVSVNGGAFGPGPVTVSPGDELRLQVTSSTSANRTVKVTVNFGGAIDTWTVTTGP